MVLSPSTAAKSIDRHHVSTWSLLNIDDLSKHPPSTLISLQPPQQQFHSKENTLIFPFSTVFCCLGFWWRRTKYTGALVHVPHHISHRIPFDPVPIEHPHSVDLFTIQTYAHDDIQAYTTKPTIPGKPQNHNSRRPTNQLKKREEKKAKKKAIQKQMTWWKHRHSILDFFFHHSIFLYLWLPR